MRRTVLWARGQHSLPQTGQYLSGHSYGRMIKRCTFTEKVGSGRVFAKVSKNMFV